MAKVLLGDVVDHIKDKVDKDTTDLEFYVGGEHIDGDEITVRRRGRIEGMDDVGGGKMIRGFVPLSEMFGYSTDLRSKTQGRGNYSMFFEKYEPVPKNIQEKILNGK